MTRALAPLAAAAYPQVLAVMGDLAAVPASVRYGVTAAEVAAALPRLPAATVARCLEAAAERGHARQPTARTYALPPERPAPLPERPQPGAPTPPAARDVLVIGTPSRPRPRRATARILIAGYCAAAGIAPRHMLSSRRDWRTVQHRQRLYWLLHAHTGLSLPEIGRLIGGRDHTTILHGVRRAAPLAAALGLSPEGPAEAALRALASAPVPSPPPRRRPGARP